jgi:acyl-CoA synthetase (NDP forming)
LLEALPTLGYIGNPLDPWGAAEPAVAYGACFSAFADAGAFDVLVGVHDFPYRSLPGEEETSKLLAGALLDATRDRPDLLPVYVSLTSGEISHEVKAVLDAAGGAPLLRGAREAFRAIAHRARWEARRERRLTEGPLRDGWPALAADRTPYGLDPTGGPSEADTPSEGLAPSAVHAPGSMARPPRRVLTERESLELLRAARLPVVEAVAAADAESAVNAAAALGYPVAVKLDAAGLGHKSDIGGVRLGLDDAEAVRAAVEAVVAAGRRPGAIVRGVLVEPMAPPGIELIVGLKRDPLFGPAVLVGLGGVFAEVLDDVVIRLAPVGPEEAAQMLHALRGAALLGGARGRAPVDREAVIDLIVALGRLGAGRPDIAEVDLNPVIGGPGGALAVDALVVLEGEAGS